MYARCCSRPRFALHASRWHGKNRYSGYSHPIDTTTTKFEDAAFQWARKHPELARQLLQVPDMAHLEPSPPFLRSIPQRRQQQNTLTSFSLVDYLTWRKWKLPQPQDDDGGDNNNEAATCALRLVSHTLSAPLTLATFLQGFMNSMRISPGGSLRCCCVGARAEATLPPAFWNELLVLLHHCCSIGSCMTLEHPPCLNIMLEFVGPDVVARSTDVVLSYQDMSLTLSWSGGGRLFHQLDNACDGWDALIFFNPGFGHPNLKESWRPTLETLFHDGIHLYETRLLLTAHSPLDVQRDVELLKEYSPMNQIRVTDYQLNPFASRIAYSDPFLKGHWVQPNLYAYQNDPTNLRDK